MKEKDDQEIKELLVGSQLGEKVYEVLSSLFDKNSENFIGDAVEELTFFSLLQGLSMGTANLVGGFIQKENYSLIEHIQDQITCVNEFCVRTERHSEKLQALEEKVKAQSIPPIVMDLNQKPS